MSQGLDMTVNSLPSRTWNWLKMNESKLKEIEAGDTWDVKEVAGESKEIACLTEDAAENQEVFSHIHTGMGPDMDRLGKMAGSQAIMIKSSPKSEGGSEPVRLHFSCEDNKKSFQKVEILAKEGEEVTVLMDYTSRKKHLPVWQLSRQSFTLKKGQKYVWFRCSC